MCIVKVSQKYLTKKINFVKLSTCLADLFKTDKKHVLSL